MSGFINKLVSVKAWSNYCVKINIEVYTTIFLSFFFRDEIEIGKAKKLLDE